MSLRGKSEQFSQKDKSEKESVYEDNRFSGKTVNKARQKQKRESVIGARVSLAEQKRTMGFPLDPQEQFLMDNREILLS